MITLILETKNYTDRTNVEKYNDTIEDDLKIFQY